MTKRIQSSLHALTSLQHTASSPLQHDPTPERSFVRLIISCEVSSDLLAFANGNLGINTLEHDTSSQGTTTYGKLKDNP